MPDFVTAVFSSDVEGQRTEPERTLRSDEQGATNMGLFGIKFQLEYINALPAMRTFRTFDEVL